MAAPSCANRSCCQAPANLPDDQWPQAKKQTQWPGEGSDKGRKGDPVFDAFYATQVEALVSLEETEKAKVIARDDMTDIC